ncbi:MAG TPA: hypothetical protein VF765_13215 [Polyangiaceae bacterium]
MYRGSQESLAETVARLEGEIAELRSLHTPARPREKTLWAVTALSAILAVLSCVALRSAHERAEFLQRRFDAAAMRLDMKTQDLTVCEHMMDRVPGPLPTGDGQL